jgi:hypothetical protein
MFPDSREEGSQEGEGKECIGHPPKRPEYAMVAHRLRLTPEFALLARYSETRQLFV